MVMTINSAILTSTSQSEHDESENPLELGQPVVLEFHDWIMSQEFHTWEF